MTEILELEKVERPAVHLASQLLANQFKNVTSHGTEICVCCGADTGIPTDLDINLRTGYISGGGQLCGHCAEIFS